MQPFFHFRFPSFFWVSLSFFVSNTTSHTTNPQHRRRSLVNGWSESGSKAFTERECEEGGQKKQKKKKRYTNRSTQYGRQETTTAPLHPPRQDIDQYRRPSLSLVSCFLLPVSFLLMKFPPLEALSADGLVVGRWKTGGIPGRDDICVHVFLFSEAHVARSP